MKYAVALLCAALLAQTSSKVTIKPVDKFIGLSPWLNEGRCGGLHAQLWTEKDGWHEASCSEIAEKIGNLRDSRNVGILMGHSTADLLAYSQYEYMFRIDRADFKQAQENCRRLLSEGFAHPDILAQCKQTVAGVVPYGLKLRDPK